MLDDTNLDNIWFKLNLFDCRFHVIALFRKDSYNFYWNVRKINLMCLQFYINLISLGLEPYIESSVYQRFWSCF